MFPAPELVAVETAYKRERMRPLPARRRVPLWAGLRRNAARRLGPTPRADRPVQA